MIVRDYLEDEKGERYYPAAVIDQMIAEAVVKERANTVKVLESFGLAHESVIAAIRGGMVAAVAAIPDARGEG